tara:strand:+ start:10195 stop:10353 length:159 start_codon:yes stop_codon:yes gene_type:complete
MTSIWAGRWGKYHRIKKKMHEWHKKGISMKEMEQRIRTMTDNKPAELRVVDD